MREFKIYADTLFEDGKPIPQRPDPDGESAPEIDPKMIVWHYTAGGENAEDYFATYHRPLSVHLVVSRDGTVTQMLALNRKGLHAGQSSWNGLHGLNNHSIGVEIENWGPLNRVGNHWETWTGRAIDDASVFVAKHKNGGPERGWERFTPEQIEAAIALAKAIRDDLDITENVGHDDVAPTRKIDPGPAFPLGKLQAIAQGNEEDGPDESALSDESVDQSPPQNQPSETAVVADVASTKKLVVNETLPRLTQPDSLRNLASKKLAVTASGGWSIQSIVTSVLDKFSEPYTLAFGAFAILIIAGLIGWYIKVQADVDKNFR